MSAKRRPANARTISIKVAKKKTNKTKNENVLSIYTIIVAPTSDLIFVFVFIFYFFLPPFHIAHSFLKQKQQLIQPQVGTTELSSLIRIADVTIAGSFSVRMRNILSISHMFDESWV